MYHDYIDPSFRDPLNFKVNGGGRGNKPKILGSFIIGKPSNNVWRIFSVKGGEYLSNPPDARIFMPKSRHFFSF